MKSAACIAEAISSATTKPFHPDRTEPAAGGSINRALVLVQNERRYFVKLNQTSRLDMFAAEAEGLTDLAKTQSVRVPAVICHGADDEQAFLVLEYLELASGGATAAATLGTQLARLHRTTNNRYGWHRDNTLGTTPQPNAWRDHWISFLREQRLGYQLDLLGDDRLSDASARLFEDLPSMFEGYKTVPSLIHGDLWGGNWGALLDGEPVIYDPACYFGDREMEIAMTELFGGFPPAFYDAYNDSWPLDAGYEWRKNLYLLYHVLNHANLFGGGYHNQAKRIMQGLLSKR